MLVLLFGFEIWANPMFGKLNETGAISLGYKKNFCYFLSSSKFRAIFWASRFKIVISFQNLKENSFQYVIFLGMTIWSIKFLGFYFEAFYFWGC